jgi:hypothetical protein
MQPPKSLRHQVKVPVDFLPLLKPHRQMILGQPHQLVVDGQRQLQMTNLRFSIKN